MLSQRVAKFYLALAWKAAVPNAQAEHDKAKAEFVAALDTLANAPEATAQIKQEIELARNQWAFFEVALAPRGSDGAASERSSNVSLTASPPNRRQRRSHAGPGRGLRRPAANSDLRGWPMAKRQPVSSRWQLRTPPPRSRARRCRA